MFKLISHSAIFLCFLSCLAHADIIYLRNGNSLEVNDAEIKGEFVVFSFGSGTVAIELSAVERIEKTQAPARGIASLRGTIGGITATAMGGQRPGDTVTSDLGAESQSEQEDQGNNEIIQFFISQKLQIERENFFFRQQINTLNSVIYAKAAIFSDTSRERQRIITLEEQINRNQERIEQLYSDARQQGLLPGDIRQIEDAKFEAPVEDIQQPLIMGEEGDENIYLEDTEEPVYSEETEGSV